MSGKGPRGICFVFTISWQQLRALFAAPQTLPAPVGEPAAVYREGMAVDVATQARVNEERHRLRYVLRLGETSHGSSAFYILISVAT